MIVAGAWSTGLIGAACKLSRWSLGDRVGGALYAVGVTLSLALTPALWHHGGAVPTVLFVGAAATGAVGARWFGRNWPTLNPTVFSFHEVWHVLTIVAAAAHFGAVWMLVT